MNKLLAAVVVATALGMAGTSANAGVFSDFSNRIKSNKSQTAAILNHQGPGGPGIVRQPKPAPNSLSYLGNKPYIDCLNIHNSFAKNDAQRKIASNICTQRYYY